MSGRVGGFQGRPQGMVGLSRCLQGLAGVSKPWQDSEGVSRCLGGIDRGCQDSERINRCQGASTGIEAHRQSSGCVGANRQVSAGAGGHQ